MHMQACRVAQAQRELVERLVSVSNDLNLAYHCWVKEIFSSTHEIVQDPAIAINYSLLPSTKRNCLTVIPELMNTVSSYA